MTYRNAGVNTQPDQRTTVVVQNLGDGRVLETVRTIPNALANYKFITQVEDGVPLSFKATTPTKTTEVTTVEPPVGAIEGLDTNELVHEVENLDLFTVRRRTVSRPPITGAQSGKEWRGPRDGEGSEFTSKVQKVSTLGANTLDVSTGQFILDSKVTPVSPTQSLLETSTAPSFPILTETIQDKRTRFKLTRTKSIVDNTFVPINPPPGTFYQTRALDSERSELIQETAILGIDGSGVADVYQKFEGMIDVQLPPELKTVTSIANLMNELQTYSTDADTYATAVDHGSASIHGRGSCKAAAGVVTDVTWTIRDPWGRDVPCTHYLFPVLRENTNLRAGFHMAIWNSFFGLAGSIEQNANLLPWPQFAPTEVSIACKSQRITLTAEADAAYAIVTALDYLGVKKSGGSMQFIGNGGEADIELSSKVVRIPPTIHPALTISQLTINELQPFANANSNFTMGGLTKTMDCWIKQGAVIGSVLNANNKSSAIVATSGTQTIPVSGVYLYKFFAEPYDYDYMMLHYILVDFNDIK